MIPELKVYLSKPDGSITWNTDWISEFESPWSIFQKIQFTNLLNKRDYFHLFGTSETIKKRLLLVQEIIICIQCPVLMIIDL